MDLAIEITELEDQLTEKGLQHPEPYGCPYCDFGLGRRGMDRCAKCDGTGSIFKIGLVPYPNTEQGYHDACKRKLEDVKK